MFLEVGCLFYLYKYYIVIKIKVYIKVYYLLYY